MILVYYIVAEVEDHSKTFAEPSAAAEFIRELNASDSAVLDGWAADTQAEGDALHDALATDS